MPIDLHDAEVRFAPWPVAVGAWLRLLILLASERARTPMASRIVSYLGRREVVRPEMCFICSEEAGGVCLLIVRMVGALSKLLFCRVAQRENRGEEDSCET